MLVTRQKILRRFWYAVIPLERLKDGPQPFTLLGEKIVLWLDAEGKPAAVQDRCCHRTAQLSKGFVESGNIVCGYHGWTYDKSGKCVRIPQNPDHAIPSGACVPGYRCEARYGYAWVALDEPLQPIPEIAEDRDPKFRRILEFYETWKCSGLRFMENSFDNAHFSFVHKGTFGVAEHPKPSKYELWPTAWGFDSATIVPTLNPPATYRLSGSTDPIFDRHLRNKWFMPFARVFHATYPSGLQHIIVNCATPIDDGTIQLSQWLYRNDTEEDCSAKELMDWDRAVIAEDQAMLEATDPDACVDTRRRVEFHMASDKPGLLIRQALMQLLEQHGEVEVHG
jgi:phenylpropionate dioxygenase-like ring-hydroxylating dioxygenase large terminal subunit